MAHTNQHSLEDTETMLATNLMSDLSSGVLCVQSAITTTCVRRSSSKCCGEVILMILSAMTEQVLISFGGHVVDANAKNGRR